MPKVLEQVHHCESKARIHQVRERRERAVEEYAVAQVKSKARKDCWDDGKQGSNGGQLGLPSEPSSRTVCEAQRERRKGL